MTNTVAILYKVWVRHQIFINLPGISVKFNVVVFVTLLLHIIHKAVDRVGKDHAVGFVIRVISIFRVLTSGACQCCKQ